MANINSFEPVVGETVSVLILGSIPGERSLNAGQYYAHPQNQFWRLIGAVLSIEMPIGYNERLNVLKENGIALWDVLEACEREGSLDSNIKNAKVNAIDQLIESHPELEMIVLNGKTAEKYFLKAVKKGHIHIEDKTILSVPSSSPAHTMPFEVKLKAWQCTQKRLAMTTTTEEMRNNGE